VSRRARSTGSRTLASKSIIERLNRADGSALGLDALHTRYTLLAELPTATEKARRDAPLISVCDVSPLFSRGLSLHATPSRRLSGTNKVVEGRGGPSSEAAWRFRFPRQGRQR